MRYVLSGDDIRRSEISDGVTRGWRLRGKDLMLTIGKNQLRPDAEGAAPVLDADSAADRRNSRQGRVRPAQLRVDNIEAEVHPQLASHIDVHAGFGAHVSR